MKRVFGGLAVVLLSGSSLLATGFSKPKYTVEPWEFDPAHSHMIQSAWLYGIGCPTNVKFDDVTYGPGTPSSPLTDPACPTGDPDRHVMGLLLAKTGPTYGNHSAGASVFGFKGQYLSEVGYDLRKPATLVADPNDPRGSHCGGGSPRFNIVTERTLAHPKGVLYFLACNSPAANLVSGGPNGGFIRLRWGTGAPGSVVAYGYDLFTNTWLPTATPITDKVKTIDLVMDEGQDAAGGPDSFGVAILDNIDINGILIGHGDDDE